ncbi:coq1 putative hexaprenyl diphosphate synthase [Dimargaris xerosporica]|nr:coq1 putative hexaprenyl diphosphate synthase [Dimargaris xerosporica]
MLRSRIASLRSHLPREAVRLARLVHGTALRPTWAEAISKAETLVQPPADQTTDIRKVASDHLAHLTSNLHRLVESEHPMLSTMSKYYFEPESGKHFRPLVVLLMSLATSVAPKACRVNPTTDYFESIDHTVSKLFSNTYYATNHATSPQPTGSFYQTTPAPAVGSLSSPPPPLPYAPDSPHYHTMYTTTTHQPSGCTILPSQRRLSEIVELMHTATLLHDDVVDEAHLRRNKACVHLTYGNKMAILVGDFLIARACCALTRLRHNEVTELLATVISDLTEGEVMQLKNTQEEAIVNPQQLAASEGPEYMSSSESTATASGPTADTFSYYLEKSYLKTAAFIAKSCRASALLGGCTEAVADTAFSYGKSLGLAFQLVDDMLDFTVSKSQLGKPVGADLKLGLATAPVLYAWQEFPELGPLVQRRFSQPNDTQAAWDLVHRSQGVQKTYELAQTHCNDALQALEQLPNSPARQALVDLTANVLNRKK